MSFTTNYGNFSDPSMVNAASSWANSQAQAAYSQAKANGESEDRALAAAKFAWQQKMDAATQTGMWNGQYNMPSDQYFANTFGTWMPNGPEAGQQTLTAQQQQYQQAFNNSQLYGQYFAPGGTTPAAGQQTQSAQQQAFAQAQQLASMYGGVYQPGGAGPQAGQQTLAQQQQGFTQNLQTEQEARAAQNQQQTQTQAYLTLLSQMRGPQNYFQYQNVLGSTPGGMRDLYAAAMGQYVPGGGATTGAQPQVQSLQGLMGDVSGQGYAGQGGGQLGQPNVYTGQPQQGSGQTWGSGIGVGAQQPTAQQQAQGMGGGTNLPAPNQISAESWKNMAPSQQQLLLSGYEAQGWNKDDVLGLMNQALPKYGTNTPTAGTWRMQ